MRFDIHKFGIYCIALIYQQNNILLLFNCQLVFVSVSVCAF
jgi:hypothetical protein